MKACIPLILDLCDEAQSMFAPHDFAILVPLVLTAGGTQPTAPHAISPKLRVKSSSQQPRQDEQWPKKLLEN